MKILHTADWHLGCSLGAEKRFEEHDALLDHFCKIIKENNIEAVIIAGDVFDMALPPNRAAEQYYRFLLEAERAGARDIIVIGGNHDSASYLEAPKDILKYLSVHVFATASQECSDMIIELKNADGTVAALVGAVPYLHEKDILKFESGQGVSERETALRNAVLAYYHKMADALNARSASVPHIVTGHLFAADSGRKNDSWIGTLMSISTADLPPSIDYVALGHLHDADTLKTPHDSCVRYPGAPLNVSFRELEKAKTVTVIDTDDIKNIRELPLPSFQDMRVLRGSREELESMLIKLAGEADHSVWCKVENTGEYAPGLWGNLNILVKNSKVKIIHCVNSKSNPEVIERMPQERHLADLSAVEVFKLMLKENGISDETADYLLAAFNEIETTVNEDGE